MTVITATTRLARELRLEYDREQVATGLSAWPSAEIMPWAAWLSELWMLWSYSWQPGEGLRLLRPAEEWAIWEDIIRSGEGIELLQVTPTVDAAVHAWNLLCGWNLSLDVPEWSHSTDSEAFHQWAVEFQFRCKANDWLSRAQLAAFMAERIEDGSVPVPGGIELAGFLELTPVQERLVSALRGRGVDVAARESGLPDTSAFRAGLIDRDAEIRRAAEWALQCLEQKIETGDWEHSIGIVVPDLTACRGRVERIFSDEFHPRRRLRPDLDSRRLFNISLGKPVGEYPIIEAAFLILDSNPQAMPVESVARVLRSPFFGVSDAARSDPPDRPFEVRDAADAPDARDSEWVRRAMLSAALRSSTEPEVSVSDVISMAQTPNVPYHCPQLAALLRDWVEMRRHLESWQMPSDWAASVSDLLNSMRWPGDGPLNSADFQTMEVWNELLSELAGLDGVTRGMTLQGAVKSLRRLTASRQFQPESDPAPVQILGVFEASGLQFGSLWIMGMHDGVWPASAAPDPFLPVHLQRRLNLPGSSPGRELAFARGLTDRLLASAPSVVVSHPERENDAELRVSPLFASLPEVELSGFGVTTAHTHMEDLWRSSRLEFLEDLHGPPFNEMSIGGGTALFKYQSACPFKAFGQLRLGGRDPGRAEPGLSALDRGILVHDILDRIWSDLGSHGVLLSMGPERLAAVARTTVGAAIDDMATRRRALREPRFAAIEQARLEKLVTEWLKLEAERQPFKVLRQEEKRSVRVCGIDVQIRADRVDQLEDRSLVILDYKSGEHGPSRWEGERPDDPQLPVYATSAESEVAGIFFGNLKAGHVGFRGLSVSERIVPGVKPAGPGPRFGERIDDWQVVLNRLAAEFREGKAAVDPKDLNATCRHCPLPTFCRVSERKRPQPLVGESGNVEAGASGPVDD